MTTLYCNLRLLCPLRLKQGRFEDHGRRFCPSWSLHLSGKDHRGRGDSQRDCESDWSTRITRRSQSIWCHPRLCHNQMVQRRKSWKGHHLLHRRSQKPMVSQVEHKSDWTDRKIISWAMFTGACYMYTYIKYINGNHLSGIISFSCLNSTTPNVKTSFSHHVCKML